MQNFRVYSMYSMLALAACAVEPEAKDVKLADAVSEARVTPPDVSACSLLEITSSASD